VRSGEIVLVTDRDEMVAELRPARRQFGAADSLDELLDSLVERGELTRASLSKRRWRWNARGLGLSGVLQSLFWMNSVASGELLSVYLPLFGYVRRFAPSLKAGPAPTLRRG